MVLVTLVQGVKQEGQQVTGLRIGGVYVPANLQEGRRFVMSALSEDVVLTVHCLTLASVQFAGMVAPENPHCTVVDAPVAVVD